MKNTKLFFATAIAILSLTNTTIAQSVYKDSNIDKYISKRTIDINLEADYTGSPYLDKEFKNGSIDENGVSLAHNVGLRYNASRDLFEIKKTSVLKDNQAKVLISSNGLTINLSNNKFIYLSPNENNTEQGYFITVLTSENTSVLKKITKTFIAGQKAYNSMASPVAATYKEKAILFLLDSEGILTEVPKSKNGKIKAFNGHSKELKAYLKENKVNLNKEKGIVKLTEYYNTL